MALDPKASTESLDAEALRHLTFEAVTYEVSREKIREYALAIADANPLHTDAAAARAAGYPDLLAPPSFQALVTGLPWSKAISDADWVRRASFDLTKLLHGEQSFELHHPIHPGMTLTVRSTVADVHDKGRFVLLQLSTTATDSNARIVIDALAGYVLLR